MIADLLISAATKEDSWSFYIYLRCVVYPPVDGLLFINMIWSTHFFAVASSIDMALGMMCETVLVLIFALLTCGCGHSTCGLPPSLVCCQFRGVIRMVLKIPGSAFDDCLVSCLCQPCVVTQMVSVRRRTATTRIHMCTHICTQTFCSLTSLSSSSLCTPFLDISQLHLFPRTNVITYPRCYNPRWAPFGSTPKKCLAVLSTSALRMWYST